MAFSVASWSVGEAAGTVSLRLVVTSPASTSGSVQLAVGSGSARNGADFTLAGAPVTIGTPAEPTLVVYSFPLTNDTDAEADEYVMLKLQNPVGVQIGSVNSQLVLILDDDKQAPAGDASVALQLLTTYRNPSAGSSEIVAYDKVSKRLFIANSVANRIDIVNFSNPAALVATSSISVSALSGSINSVAVNNDVLAAAIENTDKALDGKVVFSDANGTKLSEVTTGALPDIITFSPDGCYVLTANEGEPNDNYSVDPEGSVTVIDVSGGVAVLTQANAMTAGFTSFNGQKDAQPAQKGSKVVRQQVMIPVMFEPNSPFTYTDGAQVSYYGTERRPVAESSDQARFKQVVPVDTNGLLTGNAMVYRAKGANWQADYMILFVRKKSD